MGYKTITFSSEVETRTYVQGVFMGKYYGSINDELLFSKTELYDIHIYEGEISNLKNDREHPEIINDIVYNTIISETKLTQKSFENVLVNLTTSISDFDSITLDIKEPKLEAVQIYDVVKDGNQTFGTLTCLVSGYLLEIETKYDTIEVETCDSCKQVLEECTCKESTPIVIEEENNNVHTEVIKESFWDSIARTYDRENRARLWNELQTSGFGCLGFIGLLFSLLFLFSLGLPGIVVGLFIGLLYAFGSFNGFFPALPHHWRQLLYTFIGILLLGLFLNLFKKPLSYNSLRNDFRKVSENFKGGFEKIHNNPAASTPKIGIETRDPNATNSKNDIPNTNYSNTNLEADSSLLLREGEERPLEQTITLYKDTLDDFYTDSAHIQQKPPAGMPNVVSNPPNELGTSNTDTQQNTTPQSEASINDVIATEENTVSTSNETLILIETTQNQMQKSREKVKRIPQVMSSIIFHEGDIYVCKEDGSKRYHLTQNCSALENCTSTIYQTNIPVAERDGRTLCELEK
ncbi:hypothetical protein [Zobellia laminariae]|uniref:hypothetical protein n=1 Tax=Zobellia laminariae TaxID=248906 RepID=UPI003EF54B4D